MATTDEVLQQAMAAAKAGQRDTARGLFQAVLRDNPRSEVAWLWLSGLLDDPARQRDCLQRVLALNPANEAARRGMERLAQSEAASFLAAFEPRTPPPPPPAADPPPAGPPPAFNAAGDDAAPPLAPVPINLGDEGPLGPVPSAPIPAAPSGPIDLPPVSKITEAPCVFCGAPTGVEAVCQACGMEQVFDCPDCARVLDLREGLVCECGHSMQQYVAGGTMDRERLGDAYESRDYPATAVKQWKAALPGSPRAAALHRKIANIYMNLGLIEQARMHNELSKQR